MTVIVLLQHNTVPAAYTADEIALCMATPDKDSPEMLVICYCLQLTNMDIPLAASITISRPVAHRAYKLISSEGGFQLVEKVSNHLMRFAGTV